jgi:tripartite-type tricarboxylate transporter receptor subunit TctC
MRASERFGLLLLAAPSLAAGSAYAQIQQKYPVRPVRIVVPFSAGSATDITARLLGPKLSEAWAQPVVIENRPGAGGTVAAAMVAKATPDGYTLLLTSAAFAITAVLNTNLPYDPLKDFTGVTQVGFTTGVLAAAPALNIKTVKELIALAQERPGKLVFGSAGAGSGIHITAERFRLAAGIKAVHVGFKGQPEMLVEIMAGRIHFGAPSLGPALPLIRDGRLTALAVVTAKRSPLLPEVPALVEVLPNFERDASHAILAPARTPRAVLNQISKEVARVLELPDVKDRMQTIGFEPAPTTPEEFDRILRRLIATMSKVVVAAGLREK